MSQINFTFPLFPSFLVAGKGAYQPGEGHMERRGIGVYDLIIVTQGCLYIEEDGLPFTVPAGHYLLLKPQGHHKSFSPCIETTAFSWLHFDQKSIVQGQKRQSALGNQFHCCMEQCGRVPTPHVTLLLRQLVDKQWDSSLNNYRALQNLFEDLLFQFCPCSCASAQAIRVTAQVEEFVKSHLSLKLTARTLEKALNYNASYLNRCVREAVDLTTTQLIVQCKIDHAKYLLTTTDDSISDVCRSCGFESASYFANTFRKMTGFPPHRFRRIYQTY